MQFLLLMGALVLTLVILPNIAQSAALGVGAPAPYFDLPATGGKNVKLSDYKGQNLIIVFYPKDQTPGCTTQLCRLRDDLSRFQAKNTAIIASNPADLKSHEAFAQKQHYTFPILVDKDRAMAKAYGVGSVLGFNDRTVFIVDAHGTIAYVKKGMPSNEELSGVIEKLNQKGHP